MNAPWAMKGIDAVAAVEAAAPTRLREPAFRLLRAFLRCGDDEFEFAAKKILTAALPENSHEPREAVRKALFGLPALPLALFLRKRSAWTPEPRTDWTLETISPAYYRAWFEETYRLLPGTKRIAPRAPGDFPDGPVSAPVGGSVRPRDVLRLLFYAPTIWLCLLAARASADEHTAFRRALSAYAVFRGHFERYPCRRFLTYADESNHPVRYAAFRQSGGTELIVVQNGERTDHPLFAYGMADRYLVFGPRYEEILRGVRVRAASFPVVGALCLNEHYARLKPLLNGGAPAVRWDVLYMDQGLHPYNGLRERTNRGIEACLSRLGRLRGERPGLHVAYQSRGYADPAVEADVLARVRALLGEGAEILPGGAPGASYVAALSAELVMTFQSTLGFESLRLGRKALFVNFSGDPSDTVCEDTRFQLEDPDADYGRFKTKVEELLALRLDAPPSAALARHPFFDGQVQRRVAAAAGGLT